MNTALSALAALAHERRLQIFRLLVGVGPEGCAAGEIGEELGLAPATLSFHLKELANAGLVRGRPDARFIYYSAAYEQMADLLAYLTEHCCQGMPQKCLTTIGNAVEQCCPPARSRKPARRT